MNFGETLAYWYLRLNGFLPMTNVVVHRSGAIEDAADVDILAVRFPYAYEVIGGTASDQESIRCDECRETQRYPPVVKCSM